MDLKKSNWLSFSTKLLQTRISYDSKNTNQFITELNLRREAVSEAPEKFTVDFQESIEGVYQVLGANSENEEDGYFGILTLKYDENRIFATWLIEGEDTQTGFGLLSNNILSLSFVYTQDNVEYTGLVSYEFLSKNIISGRWVEEGSDQMGVEFGRKLPLEPRDPLKFFGFN
jgi:hypothetical protein